MAMSCNKAGDKPGADPQPREIRVATAGVMRKRIIGMDIAELLAFSVKNTASDLHLSSGLPPMLRVHGDVRRINLPAMEH